MTSERCRRRANGRNAAAERLADGSQLGHRPVGGRRGAASGIFGRRAGDFRRGVGGLDRTTAAGRGHHHEPLAEPSQRPRPIVAALGQVEQLHPGLPGYRFQLPEKVHPISAGVKGGVLGGLVMPLPALAYGLASGNGIWFPVNLLAGMVIPGVRTRGFVAVSPVAVCGKFVYPRRQFRHFRSSLWCIAADAAGHSARVGVGRFADAALVDGRELHRHGRGQSVVVQRGRLAVVHSVAISVRAGDRCRRNAAAARATAARRPRGRFGGRR